MNKLVAAAVMLVATGCTVVEMGPATETFEASPAELAVTFSLRGEGRSVVATVSDAAIVSGEVNVGRFLTPTGSALRGVAFGQPVNLDLGSSMVTGLVGGRPLNLTVTRRGRLLHLEGLVRGSPSDFHLGPRAAAGVVGGCSYDLSRTRGGYEGRRSCGGASEYVVLRLPPALERWSDTEVGAALAILLGGRR